MRILKFATSTEAYIGVIRAFLTNQDGITDGRSGLRTFSNDVVIQVENPDVTIDLSQVGFTPARWNTFLAHYFEADGFSTFYQRVVHGKAVQQSGYTCPVSAPHTMGNCLIGITAHNKPISVSLHSRACIWAPTGLLDLSFASLVVQNLKNDCRRDVGRVVWHIDQLQINCIKALPAMSEFGFLEDVIAGNYNYSPFGRLAYYEYHKLEKTIHSPYKTYRRYAGKMEKLQSGDRPKPYLPVLPDYFRLASIRKLPGRVSLEDLANEFEYDLTRLQWSARQMGLSHRSDVAMTWEVGDPRIQRLISIIKHSKDLRGVGG